MQTSSTLALGVWLGVATSLSAGAQPTLPQGPPDRPCDQPAEAAASGAPDGHAVLTTITGVDPHRGALELETKEGRFWMATPVTAGREFREGDALLVCFEGDNIDAEERLADVSL